MNQRKAISLLLQHGELSRAKLAKAAGMSQPTAGKIISALIEQRVICETGQRFASVSKTRLGRPGRMLRLEDHHARFMGIELGVKETLLAGLTLCAKPEWSRCFATTSAPKDWLLGFKSNLRGLRLERLQGLVASVSGIVDEASGHIHYCPNLHWLENFDLAAKLRNLLGFPVILVQEIRALALGHIATTGPKDLLLIDFGVGVGGAVIFEGNLQRQGTPLSGEIGHTPVPGNARRCGCGATGCLETLVSEPGLLATFEAEVRAPNPSLEDLSERIRGHGIEPWLESSIQAAGRIIAGALNVLGMHRVVVTGYPARLPGAFLDALRRQIAQDALWGRFGEVVCEAAPRRRFEGMVVAGLGRVLFPQMEGAPATGDAEKGQLRYNRNNSL
jgi:predicted NBD/HSP70 family sugar kinase